MSFESFARSRSISRSFAALFCFSTASSCSNWCALLPELSGFTTVDESFSAQYSGEFDFGFAAIGGDTDEPERLEQELLRAADEFANYGPDPADLDRIRRFASPFNSTESVARGFSSSAMRDLTPFDGLDLLRSITADEVHARGKSLLDASRCARSVLEPRSSPTS